MATEARRFRWHHCRLSDVVIAFSLASLMSLDGWSRLTTHAMVFAHLLMPHPPSVFDEDIGVDGASRLRWAGYLGNIVLADREFGRIRDAMIDRGTWDRTTVIVTSDHHWRSQLEALGGHLDLRTPFLFKPVNGGPPRTLSEPFNTIVTKDLVLATLRGEVTTSEDAETWIRSNPRDFTHQIAIDETEMQSPGGDAR